MLHSEDGIIPDIKDIGDPLFYKQLLDMIDITDSGLKDKPWKEAGIISAIANSCRFDQRVLSIMQKYIIKNRERSKDLVDFAVELWKKKLMKKTAL